MFVQPAKRLRTRIANGKNILLLCCLCIFVSSCFNGQVGSGGSATPTAAIQVHPATPKSDATGAASEALARNEFAKIQKILDGMSLEEKLGQLIVVEYVGKDYEISGLQEMIKQQHVGGFMYQESNSNFYPPYNVIANVSKFSQRANTDARIPLLIATDQEGGVVNRLLRFHGSLPSAQDMAASGKPEFAQQQGTQFAHWMLDMGINADLAPVVDVHTVDPPVLGTRMFGRDPQTVATYAGAFIDGLQQNKVIGCLKHFPGLGGVNSDPHANLPTLSRSREEIDKIDLAPYKTLLQQNHPAMIMSTDVLVPAIDPTLPAELSPKAINGVLRHELGYDGVVITDGLYMGGIIAKWSISEASVLSIIAGNDLIEGPSTPEQVASVLVAFKKALQEGRLTQQRIDEAVGRILLMKMRYGIIQ